MKIELKKIEFSERMSEETNAFAADIHVDGVKIGYARNDGRGSCTDYHCYEGKKELLRKAEQHCLTLPPIKYPEYQGMKAFEVPMNLENMIDQLLEDHLKQKANKKFEKKFATALIFEHETKIWTVDLKKPLAGIPQIELQRLVDLYKNQMKAINTKATLMNNNLEKLGIKL